MRDIEISPLRATKRASIAVTSRLSDIEAQPVEWLWPQKFARGKVSLIAGNPGLGKSQITANMAAIITSGGRWPIDGSRVEPSNVLILSAEDDAADTIVPRLSAAGADLTRCHKINAIKEWTEEGSRERSLSLLDDMERLSCEADRIGDVSLVVIDPVSAFLGMGRIDSHNNTDTRGVMLALQEFAGRTGAAVVCVSHLSKGRQQHALMAVMGSLGWVAGARAAFAVFRDDDSDGRRRLFLQLKNNLADDESGLAFTIESCETDAGIPTSRIAWEAEPVTCSADSIYAPGNGDRSATDEAVEFLRGVLVSGPMAARDVKREAKEVGITEKPLRAARNRLGIKPEKTGFDRGWEWALPEDALDAQDAPSREWAPSAPEGTFEGCRQSDRPCEGVAPGRHRSCLDAACAGTAVTADVLWSALDDADRLDLDSDGPPPLAALHALAERLQRTPLGLSGERATNVSPDDWQLNTHPRSNGHLSDDAQE